MKGELYNAGQPLKKEDYDHAKYTTQDAINERLLDLYSPGILDNSQEAGEALPFEITSPGGLVINVGTGTAIASGSVDSSDTTETGGERIHIPTADTLVGQNYRRTAGSGATGTGPYKESDNGLNGYTPTPQSTLTRNIPLTDDATNYVWIGYLHAIDPTVYSLHGASSAKIYPRGLDGYDILVTTSASTPVFNGNANYYLLGTVTTVAGSITVIDQSNLDNIYAKTNDTRIGITIDSSKVPASYSDGQTKFLDDHINALGSGAGPTFNNPHSQTIEDFGLALQDVDLVPHRKNHHTKGIVGDAAATTSSLYIQSDPSTPVAGDDAMVYLKQLISGEEVILEGKRYTEVWPKVTGTPPGGSAVGDVYISFGPVVDGNTDPEVNPYKPVANDADDDYYIYLVDIGGKLTARSKLVSAGLGVEELGIATVHWNGSSFSLLTSIRKFGLTGTKDLQDDSITTAKYKDASVTGPKIGNDTIVNANVNSAAGIEYTKLDLVDGIVNADVNSAAAIAYSKLDLNDSLVEDDYTDDSVTSQKIAEWDGGSLATESDSGSGIATAHLKNGAVTANKLDTSLLAGISIWNKVTVTKDDFAFGVAQFTLNRAEFLFPAKTVIEGVVIRHTESFVSGASTYTLSVGVSGDEDKFASEYEVQGPTGDTVFQASHQLAPENMGASVQVGVTAKVDSGFLNSAASGEAEIYIKTSVLP